MYSTIEGQNFKLNFATSRAQAAALGTITQTVFVNVTPPNAWDFRIANDQKLLPLMLSIVARDVVAGATILTQRSTFCQLVESNTGVLRNDFDFLSNMWGQQSSYFMNINFAEAFYLPINLLPISSGMFADFGGSFEIRYNQSVPGIDTLYLQGTAGTVVAGANPVEVLYIFTYLELV